MPAFFYHRSKQNVNENLDINQLPKFNSSDSEKVKIKILNDGLEIKQQTWRSDTIDTNLLGDRKAEVKVNKKKSSRLEALNKTFLDNIEKIRIDRPHDADELVNDLITYKQQMQEDGLDEEHILEECISIAESNLTKIIEIEEEPRIKIVEEESDESMSEPEGEEEETQNKMNESQSLFVFQMPKEVLDRKIQNLDQSISIVTEEILVNRPDDVEKILDNVAKHSQQMRNSGYGELYIREVSDSILELYSRYIDRYMPGNLSQYDNSFNPDGFDSTAYNVIYHPAAKKMRSLLAQALKDTTKEYNIEYDYMSQYLDGQQSNSWDAETGLLMKGVLLSQKEDDHSEYFLSKYSREELVNRAYRNPTFDKLTKSIATLQALTGIALNHIKDIPGLSEEDGTLTVYREITEYDDTR